jgi:ectoine hydroxylase-related dioxygenase (phytanoyl-CoA dioxygenase family)
MTCPEFDVSRFERDGYLLIKNLFSTEEIQTLRQDAFKVLAEQEKAGTSRTSGSVTFTRGELLSKEALRRLVVDGRVLSVARSLLGQKPVYFGDSNLQVGRGPRGWHKDNRLPDRFQHSAEDWQDPYTVLRFGVYLQDHTQHSGGLGIRVGSHRPSALVKKLEKVPPSRLRVLASTSYGKAICVGSEVGDLVVWNLRTTHSGNIVRLRTFPNLKMAPWIENLVPTWLRLQEEERRVAIFLTYGAKDDHLRRYIDYLKTRGYMDDSWRDLAAGRDSWSLSADTDLEVLVPRPA